MGCHFLELFDAGVCAVVGGAQMAEVQEMFGNFFWVGAGQKVI